MIGRFIFGHWRCKMERTKRLIGVVYLITIAMRFDSCCVWKLLFGKDHIVWKFYCAREAWHGKDAIVWSLWGLFGDCFG